MPLPQNIGKYLVVIGIAIVLVGLIFWFAGDKLRWIGRLPGDIRIERENFSFYFPLTTMILRSIVLSLGWRLVRRFL